MPKQKIEDVKEEIEKLDDENYGDEAVGGSAMGLEKDDDVEEMVEEVEGENLEEKFGRDQEK